MQASVWLLEPVVRDRQDRLRGEAVECRRTARPPGWRVSRAGSRRERLGWALVEFGLRLALPGGRPVPVTAAPMRGAGR